MAVEVKMPQLGESVFEGTVGKWLKQPGDAVEKYEPLLEVITDKVDTEVTAVEGGTLLEVRVPEGETVKVGTVLAVIGAAGEAVPSTGDETGAEAKARSDDREGAGKRARPEDADSADDRPDVSGVARVSPVAARVAAEHGVDVAQVAGSGRGGQVTRDDVERFVAERGARDARPSAGPRPGSARTAAGGVDGGAPAGFDASAGRDLGFISPRVAKLAAEHGVDLRQVPATGRDGRITARDVERFVAERATAPATVRPAREAPARRAAEAPAGGPAPGELLELTPMRRAIAEHMVHSVHTSPHVTTVHEVDMGAVMAAYAALKAPYAERGVKLTLTAFMLEALARAIRAHPLVNSSWTDAGIQVHRDVNLGLAVALPGGGLIVPVIQRADEKNLIGVARAVNDLAERARAKQLKPDDVQGGTFTVTNYGTLGSLFGTPVINQPQSAILGTGAIKKRVVVVESPAGDTIAIRPMMYLALTFDHRVLDGGTGDPFVQTLVRLLESYEV